MQNQCPPWDLKLLLHLVVIGIMGGFDQEAQQYRLRDFAIIAYPPGSPGGGYGFSNMVY